MSIPPAKEIAHDSRTLYAHCIRARWRADWPCGGAFDGIDKIIARRVQTNTIGFNVDKEQQESMKKNLLRYINATDLKAFGLIPELLGRLPVVTHLDPLDADTLRAILTEPKNALVKQYKKLILF